MPTLDDLNALGNQVARLEARHGKLAQAIQQQEQELERQQGAWNERIGRLQKQAEDQRAQVVGLEKQRGTLMAEVKSLESRRQATEGELTRLGSELAAYDEKLAEAKRLAAGIKAQKAELAKAEQAVRDQAIAADVHEKAVSTAQEALRATQDKGLKEAADQAEQRRRLGSWEADVQQREDRAKEAEAVARQERTKAEGLAQQAAARSEVLDEAKRGLEADRAAFLKARDEVVAAKADVDRRHLAAEARAAEVERLAASFDTKATELRAREKALGPKEAEAQSNAVAAAQALEEVEGKARELVSRETELTEREQALAAYERQLQDASLRMAETQAILRRQSETLRQSGVQTPSVPDLPEKPARTPAPEAAPAK